MARAVRWTLFLLTVACSPAPRDGRDLPADSQSSYRHAGCEDGTSYCPQDLTFSCAAGLIEARHGACQTDSDCVLMDPIPNCIGYGECPPPSVRADAVSAFQEEIGAEIEAYCATAQCRSSGSCGVDPSAVRAVCEMGRCRSKVPVPDAGP